MILDRFLRALPVESTGRGRTLIGAGWVGTAALCMTWMIGAVWNIDVRAMVLVPWLYPAALLPGLLALGISQAHVRPRPGGVVGSAPLRR